jgi:hypothetical protein
LSPETEFSENAQRELRDSVKGSLYAGQEKEMFKPPKKIKSISKLEPVGALPINWFVL